eukprot:Blabericola_migrator_1__1792@NODE_1485_length_4443_cov_10_689214_g975_i0_p1_GENE_NODE_1485_length_4443_cov_10_689214_g975_i0NODE_1485_length_4443_cov_10_689214_g975_i0_p1_ORF_typecomplete_len1231_score191_58_NODE_1485_length_4443_cov_10_689214_g975_i0103702
MVLFLYLESTYSAPNDRQAFRHYKLYYTQQCVTKLAKAGCISARKAMRAIPTFVITVDKFHQKKICKVVSSMSGSGRCILRHHNKCHRLSTTRTFSLGVSCVLSMHRAADLPGDEIHFGPLPEDFRDTIDNVRRSCRALTNASSYGHDGAWHKRAQLLLARALEMHYQVPVETYHGVSVESEVWDQIAEVLGEAENTLQTRSLSNDEVDTIRQITGVAVQFAPLYPCVSQCAKLWYEIGPTGARFQELLRNANPSSSGQRSPLVCKAGVETPSRSDVPPASNPPHPESYMHFQVPSQAETLVSSHQRRCQLPLEIWTLPSGSQGEGALLAETLQGEEELEQCNAGLADRDWYPTPAEEFAETDMATDGNFGHDHAAPKNLTIVESHVAKLIADLNLAHRSTQTSVKIVNVKERLRKLSMSLRRLNNESLTLDAQLLVTLNKLRSLLITARAKVRFPQLVRISNRYMTMFDGAIFTLSHLWHQARSVNMKTSDWLRPHELEGLRRVIDFPTEFSFSKCVASTTYAVLLTSDSNEEVTKVLDDFLTFFDLASRTIDLTTAKLYFLILLYLRHDSVKLVKTELQDLLGKLIYRLRAEIFESGKTEISLDQIPELKEFCLAYFETSASQRFDWRKPLQRCDPEGRDGQRPIITNLAQYGVSFGTGVLQLERLLTSASLASSERETYATQVGSLEAFRLHLLSKFSLSNVFADNQTLAYFKQFAAFAKVCLDECEVEGYVTGHEQLQILEVTMNCLHWCRLLSSYMEVTSPSLLEETYDLVADALILKILWNNEMTASLLNSERAFISRGILSALRSNKLDDELLVCTKMFLDRNIPTRFVETLLDKLLLFRAQKTSEHDKMVTLLATECRMELFRGKLASNSNIPSSTRKFFAEALSQARLAAKGVSILPAPGEPMSPTVQERFVASPAHEAARRLSPLVVLEEALRGTKLNDLTVSEVARHVATHLLGEPVDERWLNFLTCQVNWCSFTPQQLAERQGELMTLVQSMGTFLKAFWSKARWAKPLDSRAEATPNLIRHFVNTATLKWLVGKLKEDHMCPAESWQLLCKVAGDYVFAWMPKWMTFMHSSRALFPPNVIVDSDFFVKLCVDVCRQMYFTVPPKVWVGASQDNEEVSAELRHLVKAISLGTLTRQDFDTLSEPHLSRYVTRWNSNVFISFLLYAWHDALLLEDKNVIEECMKLVVSETGVLERDVGMAVSTLRHCITKLLSLQLWKS